MKNTDKELVSGIEKIKKLLLSNDLSLDEFQEIVDFIKKTVRILKLSKPLRRNKEDKVNLLLDYNG
ncbi:hypothetical protein EJ377_16265 [Chryseobacterium arthrosphaerae]|uniref:Uncharacterized protein n=1 Tax=Chryseobacterium arthrosphaerae TaxID=651561 RepID=A0A3S0NKS2_9FLAO|nr:hypothetical protein EJ377_16265 [Chryseobacterium arthrosphaerae]